MPVGSDLLVIAEHGGVVHLTATGNLLGCLTGDCAKAVGPVGGVGIHSAEVGLAGIVLSGVGVHTEAVSKPEVFQEFVVDFEVAIEALLLITILEVLKNIVGVGDTVRRVVVTGSVEGVGKVLHLGDGDVARGLHDRVVHAGLALARGDELVTLEGVVQRGAERDVALAMACASAEGVLVVAVGAGGNDTVIADLRERQIISTLVGGTIERQTVVETEAGVEEVLHVLLDGNVRLHVLRVVVHVTVTKRGTVERGTPRTVLDIGLLTVPAHTEHVLLLRDAEQRLPLEAAVVLLIIELKDFLLNAFSFLQCIIPYILYQNIFLMAAF